MKSSRTIGVERALAIANLVPEGHPEEQRIWSYAADLFSRSGQPIGDFELFDMRERTDPTSGRRGYDLSTVLFLAISLSPFKLGRDGIKVLPDLFSFLARDIPDIESEEGTAEFDRRFADFMKVRGFVQRLVGFLEGHRRNPANKIEFSLRTPFLSLEAVDGMLKLKADWYVDAFIGFDLSHLRVCPAKVRRLRTTEGVEKLRCGKIFLPDRKDKIACCDRCSNVLAGTKYRSKPENIAKEKARRDTYGSGNQKKGKRK